jgi:hypothetical protein
MISGDVSSAIDRSYATPKLTSTLSEEDKKTLLYATLKPYWKKPAIKELPSLLDEADLDHKDSLGPDPFHLRKAPSGPPLIERHYAFEAYPDLFSFLDLATTSKPAMPASLDVREDRSQIPSIIHFIWVGDDFTNKDFRANIVKWTVKNPGATFVLWTDNREMSPETLSWCREHRVHLVHIDDVFSNEDKMQCDEHYRLSRYHLPAGWGSASDILRYNILDRFGGVYIDVDRPEAIEIPLDHEFITVPHNCDFIGTPPHKMGGLLQDIIKERYEMTLQELKAKYPDYIMQNFRISMKIAETVMRTGPAPYVEHLDKSGYKIKHLNLKNGFAATWTKETWEAVPTKSDKKDLKLLRKKIVTNILWDLKNKPERFDVSMYKPYFDLFANPKKEETDIISFILKNYRELLKDVNQVHTNFLDSFRMVLEVVSSSKLLYPTMLMIAVKRNCYEMASYFLDKEVPQTAMCAYREGEIEESYEYDSDTYKNLASLFLQDKSGYFPVHVAAGLKDTRILEKILSKNPRAINTPTCFCRATVKYIAMQHVEGLKLLIRKGVNCKDLSILQFMLMRGDSLRVYINNLLDRDLDHEVSIEEYASCFTKAILEGGYSKEDLLRYLNWYKVFPKDVVEDIFPLVP